MKCTVKRSEWNRGGRYSEYGISQLLNEKGFKCCLGFAGEQCGYLVNELLNSFTPGIFLNSKYNK